MRCAFLISALVPAVFSAFVPDALTRVANDTQLERFDQVNRFEARDEVVTYIAWASDPNNDAELKETPAFINGTVKDKNEFITTFKSIDGSVFVWGSLTLDDDGVEKLKAYPGIKEVDIEARDEEELAISHRETTESLIGLHPNVKRAPSDWDKQEDAPQTLRLINVEKDKQLKDYANVFVYDEKVGEGSFVYILGKGVAYNVEYEPGQREFPTGKAFAIESDGSKGKNQREDEDDSTKDSHDTRLASVAVGQRFGVAKKATLISVKRIGTITDTIEAIKMIYADISVQSPDRVKKSVVNIAFNLGSKSSTATLLKKAIQPLFDLGVPVVCSSGNARQSSDSSDKFPAALYAANFPLIVVGNTDGDGNRAAQSQGSTANAVHAPGKDVECSNKDGSKATSSGTSLAAPAACGLVATYMAYDAIPWDDSKTGVDRVTEIRNYLGSDKSSVARGSDPNIRTIWNGMSKSDYDQVVGPSPIKPTQGWSLSIAMLSQVNSHSDGADVSKDWKFYTTPVGKAVGSCGETQGGQEIVAQSTDKPASDADIDNPPWPTGVFDLNIEGEQCQYRCDGTNPGALFCPRGQIGCKEDDAKNKPEGTRMCGSRVFFHPVVYCDF